ncbi:AMP-binding protein [Nocardioides sp. TF02-7]|nr:AMP-binding protein [Nocardioides sp. TF02-7]
MDGLMQPRPLTLAHVFERAEGLFGHKRVVEADGEEVTYAAWALQVRRLVSALDASGVPAGARVATLAANHRRHLEVYAAAPISKRVLHTLNVRLSPDDLAYVIDHAGDDVVFLDRRHLPVVLACADRLPGVRRWVVFPDGSDEALPPDPRFVDYDDLVAAATPYEGSFEETFSAADENLAAGLCYTSGTTGRPKGVLYSHRSTVLHCLGTMAAGLIGISERDVVLPIVPMFHANAWGLPLRRADGRRRPGAARRLRGPRPPGRADGAAPGHARGGRADGVDRPPAGAARSRPALGAAPAGRRVRRQPDAVLGLRGGGGRADHPLLGDDRDQPGRHRRRPAEPARPPRRRRPPGRCRRRRASRRRWCACASSTSSPAAHCPTTARPSVSSRSPAPGWRAGTSGARARTASPRTAGCAPATWRPSTGTATCGSSTGSRT